MNNILLVFLFAILFSFLLFEPCKENNTRHKLLRIEKRDL